MKAYKIVDKYGRCHNHKYEVGKVYKITDKVELYSRGFHACINPFDCLEYKSLFESRFFEVDMRGEVIHEEPSRRKSVCSELEVLREMTLDEYIKCCHDYMKQWVEKVSGDSSRLSTSGDYSKLVSLCDRSKLVASGDFSKLSTSGNRSQLSASGKYSKLSTSGDYSNLSASGDYSKLSDSGYGVKLAASGDFSTLSASGDFSQLAVSGDNNQLAVSGNGSTLVASGDFSTLSASGNNSQIVASGKSSIAANVGTSGKVKVSDKDSWIVLADIEDGVVRRVVSKKPGQKIDSVRIKVDVWYWFENGKLCESKE